VTVVTEAAPAAHLRAVLEGRRGRDGLGLFISRSIVAAHGGRLVVRSEPGAGSAFSFSIPRSYGKRTDGDPAAGHRRESTAI
jgi:signal transduction histidine kinase